MTKTRLRTGHVIVAFLWAAALMGVGSAYHAVLAHEDHAATAAAEDAHASATHRDHRAESATEGAHASKAPEESGAGLAAKDADSSAAKLTARPAPTQTAQTASVFRVKGMHCSGCAKLLTTKLQALPGIDGAAVSFERKEARITRTADGPTDDAVIALIEGAGPGYEAMRLSP